MNAWLNSRKLTLGALKTVFVLFSRKESFFPDLSIVVNLVRIAPAQTVQILDGLVLDANLKWMVHLKSKCVSTKRAILMANSCPRKSFGFDGNRLRFLFSVDSVVVSNLASQHEGLVFDSRDGLLSIYRYIIYLWIRNIRTLRPLELILKTEMLPFKMN